MNIISIDPSLNCTALVVNDKKFIYAKEEYGHTKKQTLTKWFEICDPFITYRWTDYPSSSDHSTNEMLKHIAYDKLTTDIIGDIWYTIDSDDDKKYEPIKIGIEGYSYSSAAGPLIDLVTLSTLLRNKLYHRVSTDITVYQPASLKLAACKFTYPPIAVGKKVIKYEYRNHDGTAGGKFKKPDIYKALIDNTNLTCEWVELLREYESACFEVKNIPKPIEDMNDAKILYEILKSACNSSQVQV